MSVQPGPTFKRYAANGVATVYTIPFLLLAATDLQITLNGVLVTTGFTLAGIGNPQSSCTFSVPPAGDLLFQMVIPFQRLTDYQMNGDFQSSTVNPDFDRLWLAVKQLNRDSNRALTVSLLEPEGIPALPVKAVRALKMLAFDVDGNPITSNLTIEQIEQQPALALESAAQAAESASAAGESEAAAGSSAFAAGESAGLALKWAENPEDTPVQPGLFSAHHWANKAAALVASISALYTRMTAVELRATNLEWGYVSSNQSYTNGGVVTVNHLLGVVPSRVNVDVIVLTAQNGYAVGSIIPLGSGGALYISTAPYGFTISVTSTQINLTIASGGVVVIGASAGAAAFTPANIALRIKASKS